MYINFIGIDGSGKDTIFNLIKEHYPAAVLTKEPGGTKEAEVIRDVLLNKDLSLKERESKILSLKSLNINKETSSLLDKAIEAIHEEGINRAEPFLYAASRSESIEKVIKPALSQNIPILGRRSVACSVAYQGSARNFGMKHIWDLNFPIIEKAYPTLEIFFDLPVSVALERLSGRTGKQDRLDTEDKAFFEKVREGYLSYYKDICPYPYVIIDASQDIPTVFQEVHNIVSNN